MSSLKGKGRKLLISNSVAGAKLPASRFANTNVQNLNIKKNDKSNSNVNIYKILYLPFDMLCYLLEIMMVW